MAPSSSALISERLKLAVVLPRFGERVFGGAELHGRWLAERLSRAGHQVDVYTTCAVDHASWRNELAPGIGIHDGLRVHRFPTTTRDLGIHGELELAIVAGYSLSREEELLWLRHGGSSEAMEDTLAARAEQFDAVIAMPYLWGTTYFAYAACPSKAVIIPCLHDEQYARLSVTSEMLTGARGLLFNTEAETAIARSLVPEMAPWGIVGVGVEAPPSAPSRWRRLRVPQPSIVYVGRREEGKNTPLLIEYFRRYRERRGPKLYLVFAGGGHPVPRLPGVAEVKPNWSRGPHEVYRAATIVCQPSINESLSLVLLQGWLAERPALVHGACEVTRSHCERSNGGLWFESYMEFETVVDRLLASAELREALGRNGRRYVESEYSWPVVLDRFHRAMGHILSAEPAAGVRAGVR